MINFNCHSITFWIGYSAPYIIPFIGYLDHCDLDITFSEEILRLK